MKKGSGITLIALVVTIVVLLILASITISLVFSDNGIIAKAREAAEKTNQAVINEQKELNELYNWIDNELNGNGNDNTEVNPPDEKHYKLTIIYKYATGQESPTEKLPETIVQTGLEIGHNYSVVSPTIKGYVAIPSAVSGEIKDSDVTKTVTYYIDSNGNGVPDSEEPNQ